MDFTCQIAFAGKPAPTKVVIGRFFCDEQTGKKYQHTLRHKKHKNAY